MLRTCKKMQMPGGGYKLEMDGEFTIELKGLRFFANHGLYPEEELLGNEFEIDVALRYKAPEDQVVRIEQTINYVEVYRIVKETFQERQQLLETCARQIACKLQEQFPQAEQLTIAIRKLNPPIINFTGSVGVIYTAHPASKSPEGE